MIRVAVTGAKGRMGSTVVTAVTGAPDMEVVAQLDAGDPITKKTVNGAQVAVDFSLPSVTEANVHALLDAGVDVVVGTTGWTDESYARVREHAEAAGRAVLIAPNFAMGAVLAMKFAAMAAPYFESAEVIEMHHPGKVDAPSGTAVATARGIAQARAQAGLGQMPDATEMDASTACPFTPCACAAWPPRRRSCWATRGSSWSSAPTPSTACPSCPVSSWACAA